MHVPFLLSGKKRKSALAQVHLHLPRPPSPKKKKICPMASLIPKIKALTGPDWVKWSHQDQLREEGHVEDL